MINQHLLGELAEINYLLEDIKEEYNEGIKLVLKRNNSFLFDNPHKIPKLEKIQINRSLGLSAQNTNVLKTNIEEFITITGQKPIITKAKKAIAGFKIRENMELGLCVTLRGKKMYAFLTKLIFFTFPQIRDFRGLSVRSFDKSGNYTIGFKEQLIFPELDYDDITQIQGFNVTFVISSSLPKTKTTYKLINGIVLFKFLRFPLVDSGYYKKYSELSEISEVWDRKKHLRRKRWSQE